MSEEKKMKKPKEKPKFKRLRSENIRVPKNSSVGEKIKDQKSRFKLEETFIRSCLAEGMSREDIMTVMKLSDSEYGRIEKRLLSDDGQRYLNMSTAYRFYLYSLQQEQCAHDLEHVLRMMFTEYEEWHDHFMHLMKADDLEGAKELPARPSMQAMVVGIKAKSDLFEKTIKLGQDMGIIEKRAKELRVSGKLNLGAMPTTELKNMLAKKLDDFQKLVDKGSLPNTYKKMLKDQNARRLPERSNESECVMDAEFTETDS